MPLLNLPAEILSRIMVETVLARGYRRALRLRLVCKDFSRHVPDAIYHSRLLDHIDMISDTPLRMKRHLSELFISNQNEISRFWHAYLVHRVQNETGRQPQRRYVDIRQVAKRVCEETGSDLASTVETLCWPALPHVMSPDVNRQLAREPWNVSVDLLCAAAYLNHLPMAARLLREGLSPHTQGRLFSSPMKLAAWAGNAQMLEMLQEHAPELEGTGPWDWRGTTGPGSLQGAAIRGDLAMLHRALYPPSQGAPPSTDFGRPACGSVDPAAAPGFTTCALVTAQSRGTRSVEVATFLRGFVASPHPSSIDPNTLVFHAHLGNLELVRFVLDAGANIRGDHCPYYPIVVACQRYSEDVVRLLLDRGADPNCYGDTGKICFKPPIVAAAGVGSLPIVRLLIRHGALLCYEDAMGRTIHAGYGALLAAVHAEHTEMVKYLVAAGVGIGGESGRRLLRSAKASGLDSMAAVLQELGIAPP